MRRNKVLIYAHYTPPQPSACATRLMSLARYLNNRGTLVEFITTNPGPSYCEGFPIRRCKGRLGLFIALSKHSSCPILVSSPPGTPAAEVAALSRFLGYKVVVDIRDPFVSEAIKNGDLKSGLSTSIKLMLERSLFSSAHVISYVSDPLRRLIEGLFGKPARQYVIAANGVDRDIFKFDEEVREEVRRELGFGDEAVITYCGILGGKSLDSAFDALAPILKKGARLQMLAVLDEYSRPVYEALKIKAQELGVCDSIVWSFNLSHNEVSRRLNASDIGLNPLPFNRSYCLPVKTFEFLACGVHPLNVVGKDNALVELFDDPKLGTFCFSWEECLTGASALLENINEIRALAAMRANSVEKFDRRSSNELLASALIG